jgi:uncharacterized protein DUF2334
MTITPLIGPNGKIPILIRDDDINFFTKSNMLESIYSNAWNNNFKVSLSVIPYQKTINDVCIPPNVRNSNKYYSIENNKELCIFLKDKINHNFIEILQHGVSHALIDDRGEFSKKIDSNNRSLNNMINGIFHQYYKNSDINNVGNSDDGSDDHNNNKINFKSYTNIGRNIIKKSLDIEPLFFTAPFDDISKGNLNLLSEMNLVPIYGQSNFHKFFRSPYIPNDIKKYLAKKISKKFSNIGFIIPFIISNKISYYRNKEGKRYKDHGIMLSIPKRPKIGIYSNNKEKSQIFVEWVSNTISNCISKRTPLGILNHYHHYFYDWNYDSITRGNLFEQWQQILTLLNQIPFSWKTSFFDFYERLKKIQNVKISKTGLKINVVSNILIEDISFKINNGWDLEKNQSLVYDEEDKTIVTIKHLQPDSKNTFYLK